jgi:proteasome lid subunit RPN8/RPN11
MNEICYIITGQQRGHLWYGRLQQRQVGQPASVEFDWEWVLAREERRGDVLGFFHTHPTGLAAPSQRDIKTMQAWVTCLGKPLLCVIKSGIELAAYCFQTDEAEGQRLGEVQRFPGNVIVCYGEI